MAEDDQMLQGRRISDPKAGAIDKEDGIIGQGMDGYVKLRFDL